MRIISRTCHSTSYCPCRDSADRCSVCCQCDHQTHKPETNALLSESHTIALASRFTFRTQKAAHFKIKCTCSKTDTMCQFNPVYNGIGFSVRTLNSKARLPNLVPRDVSCVGCTRRRGGSLHFRPFPAVIDRVVHY